MIDYTLSPESTSEHLFKVCLTADADTFKTLTISLPAWIPGSYMIRDFAKSIVDINPLDDALVLTPRDKQSWTLTNDTNTALGTITLEYTVFARDLSVRSAYINDEYAFCNGTSVFLCIEELKDTPHNLSIDKTRVMPWARTITAMNCIDDSSDTDNLRRFSSDNYETLIDHPVLIGKVTQQSFVVNETTYHVVFTGEHDFNMTRICSDLAPICQHHEALFGDMPEANYYFITLICKKGFGGLEHRASTILQYSRDELPLIGEEAPIKDDYQDFLALCSHELFHLWHVKRNKPDVMISPDLSQEVYTPQLWIYEGITSLYDDLSMARCGAITPKAYLEVMGKNITRLLRNSGREKQSIAESSFYAWNKFYKQTASSTNHIVSYYLKGGLVAFGLDVHIRNQSQDKYSLDDVLRILYRDYGARNVGTPDDVISLICREELDIDVDAFMQQFVYGTTELPLAEWLNAIGLDLQLRPRTGNADKGGTSSSSANKNDFGASLRDSSVGCKVTQVVSDSAASEADLQIDDRIISINHQETKSKHLLRELNRHSDGDTVSLHLLRDGRLLEKQLSVRQAVKDTCYVEVKDQARYEQWLNVSQ